jgi:hypothetical protein
MVALLAALLVVSLVHVVCHAAGVSIGPALAASVTMGLLVVLGLERRRRR